MAEDRILAAFFRRGEFVLGEVQRVDQFHDRRNSGVELITVADVLTGFLDGEVFLEADFLGCRGRRVGGGGGAGPHGRQGFAGIGVQAPDTVEETGSPFNAGIAPVEVAFRRRGEQAEQADGVRAVPGNHFRGIDGVALGLGHLAAVLEHHALGEQVGEGLVQAFGVEAQVAQDLGEEAGVEQVQDGVFHTADVLVHGQPVLEGVHIEGALGIAGAGVAGEVPGGLHEGVQGIGLATASPPQTGQVQRTKESVSGRGERPSSRTWASRGRSTGRFSSFSGTTPHLSQ